MLGTHLREAWAGLQQGECVCLAASYYWHSYLCTGLSTCHYIVSHTHACGHRRSPAPATGVARMLQGCACQRHVSACTACPRAYLSTYVPSIHVRCNAVPQCLCHDCRITTAISGRTGTTYDILDVWPVCRPCRRCLRPTRMSANHIMSLTQTHPPCPWTSFSPNTSP